MSKTLKEHISNPKLWVVIGIGVAGVVVISETQRLRKKWREKELLDREDLGAFIERFELLPFPQPPPPAARLPLSGLTFAVKDVFEVKGQVTGFGSPEWKKTHEEAIKTAFVITNLLKNGATYVGSTVLDEFSMGITGENTHYGAPVNPQMPTCLSGGSSSGSAVAVAAKLVDFALGTDTVGCVRIPASHCGILGFRPSHGAVSMIGVLPHSQSLDTVGWFARDPSILHTVGHVLLKLNLVEPKRSRRFIFADDLFEFSKVPNQKMADVVRKATVNLSGYQAPKSMNIGQYIASNVPSLKLFQDDDSKANGTATLKTLSTAMVLLRRYEFMANHEEWFKSFKPKVGHDVADHVCAAIDAAPNSVKALYKVRAEFHAAMKALLKDDGILVFPTTADPPLRRKMKKHLMSEVYDRAFVLSSISSMSGCCQVSVPLGKHDNYPISISFSACQGADKFLLDTVLDIYTSLQEQVSLVSSSVPFEDTNGNMDASELLKEKGNAAFKGKQWNKAVNCYTQAIKLNSSSATYYSNRAAAYLELGCFQQAEEDCSTAISIDKKNVKAYLRRGTARESLLRYKEAVQDFKHALVLEPHNRVADRAEKRLGKWMRLKADKAG